MYSTTRGQIQNISCQFIQSKWRTTVAHFVINKMTSIHGKFFDSSFIFDNIRAS